MSLEFYRTLLTLKLLSDTAFKPSEAAGTMQLMANWWACYKIWEERDTFLAAFNEGRMTVRQSPASQAYRDDFAARHTDVPNRGSKPYPGHQYQTGVDSLKQRMDPDSFGMDSGERLKYKYGLHDLSGSLLDPSKSKITTQLRWKWDKLEKWITIFMPVAKPEDLALFNLLNSMSKEVRLRQPEIYDKVTWMRRRMSRIKLAEADDMGAGLLDIAPTGKPPKFRYGLRDAPDQTGQLTGVDLDRYKKALDYTSILPLQRSNNKNVNEIVIAYRQHAGPRFPIFTKWSSADSAFICACDEPSSALIPSGQIPDQWENTVQI